jgi:hypothetical protein
VRPIYKKDSLRKEGKKRGKAGRKGENMAERKAVSDYKSSAEYNT